jgi:ABC-type Fe3+/spermidine/putrescine transport system ATPase subunit
VEGVGDFRLALAPAQSLPVGTAVDLSLRPERVSLSLDRPRENGACTTFPATVVESTYLGRSAKVQALAGKYPISIEVTYDEVGGALSALAKGTLVWLEVRHTDALLLEKEARAS